jgi:hypothetical protein
VKLRSRLFGALANPRVWVYFHGFLVVLWILLIFPSVLLWRESIVWLVIMSAWANVAGSVASLQSARADCNSPTVEDVVRLERKIDALRSRMTLLTRGR